MDLSVAHLTAAATWWRNVTVTVIIHAFGLYKKRQCDIRKKAHLCKAAVQKVIV